MTLILLFLYHFVIIIYPRLSIVYFYIQSTCLIQYKLAIPCIIIIIIIIIIYQYKNDKYLMEKSLQDLLQYM